MATKLPRRLRPTKAWNRAALWVPFCIGIPMSLVFPLYQWHSQILDHAERCCHCLGFSSGPSLWLPVCWWHCSHFKHSWMSTVPAKQIPQLTFQGAQAQHWQNKNHGLLQQRYFCDSHLHVRWQTSRTCHLFQIPWIHSHSWWKYAHSSWEDGRQLEAHHS